MSRKIRQAAVIGSGVMGGGIAALLASAGVPTLLLDIVPFDLSDEEKKDPRARNRMVKAGLDTVLKSKPSLIMQKKDADLITIMSGSIDRFNVILGSYAQQMVNKANVPLLSITPREKHIPLGFSTTG